MKKKIGLILVIFCTYFASGQTITTVAGGATGHGGYWGEGGLATAAELNIDGGLAVDKFGNMYIPQGNRVLKVDVATGIIHTVAGTGVNGYNGDGIAATTAQINGGGLVFVDTTGNFYICDGNNFRIRKVDVATGIITTFAGNGINGFCGDTGFATAQDFDYGACTFDVFGNMIFESNHHHICKIDPSGAISVIGGTGVAGNSGDGGLAVDATMSPTALGICTDNYGNIYFSDSFKAVRKINVSTGIITRVAGLGNAVGSPYSGDGGLATATTIDPVSTAVDDTGNLYIADEVNSRILKVNTLGIIYTIAGDGTHGYSGDIGPATAAEINYPENVVLDQCNNVYIADFNNARVRKVTYPANALVLTNTITASPGDTVCTGTSVIYTATAASGVGGTTYSYLWYVNGVAVSTGNNYTYTPANGDSVRCVVTGTQQCSGTATASSNTIYMVVNPYTVPTITITAPASALVGATVSVNATVTGAGSSYSINWYDNGELFNTTTVPVVTYVKGTGVDVITATVVPGGEGGCYDSTTSGADTVRVGTETSPNLSEGEGFSVYPNPVKSDLIIDLSPTLSEGEGGVSYRILSMVGAELLKGDLKKGSNSIDVGGLGAGVYVLEVVENGGGRTVTKIVKE